METTEVRFELESYKELYKKYYYFTRNQELKKPQYFITFGISILFMLIGIVSHVNFWTSLGCIISGVIFFYFIYFFIRYELIIHNMSKKLKENAIESEYDFKLSFNTEEITHTSKNATSKVNWNLISHFQENEDTLYIFFNNGQLYDIISTPIVGQEYYEKFKDMMIVKSKGLTNLETKI